MNFITNKKKKHLNITNKLTLINRLQCVFHERIPITIARTPHLYRADNLTSDTVTDIRLAVMLFQMRSKDVWRV